MIGGMGSRANFVLVDEQGWRLYYSHWGGDRICGTLIAGPAAATRFIAAQRPCLDRERDWLDDVWSEGGAVVDHQARRLVFYGGDLLYEIPAKRALSRILELTWPGWEIRWAYDGVGDLAAAVGVDRSVVRKVDEEERQMPRHLETDLSWECHLLTVCDADGELTIYPLTRDCHTAWQGPALLERLPERGLRGLELSRLPYSGLHVDVRTRTAETWLTYTSTGLVPALPELWPGWRVRFCEDRYEEQAARCGDAVTFPALDLKDALQKLVEAVGRGLGHDPVAAMLEVVQQHAGGREVELNPLFTAHQQVDPTAKEWAEVLRLAAELAERL